MAASIDSKKSNPKNKRSSKDSHEVHLSKTLSWLLRHGLEESGLQLLSGGFLFVEDILTMQQFKKYTVDDVKHVVLTNEKRRFFMEEDRLTGKLKIRANQGHTVQVDDLDLTPILNSEDVENVVHGTYYRFWKAIKTQGLKRMKRVHIHFAPGETNMISGMRKTCDVVIYIDLKKALKDGIKFYRSANDVILSPGNDEGCILPEYFMNVVDKKTRASLL